MAILFGKTVSGLIVPVLVDDLGNLQVDGTMSIIGHNFLDGNIHPDTIQGTPQKGDVIIGIDQGASVIKWQRLARGATGQVLTVQSDGSLAWADAGGGDVVLIEDKLLGSDVASVTFSNIPATYKHLRLIGAVRSATATSGEFLRGQFNGDTGANYDSFYMYVKHNASLSTGELFAATSTRLGICTGNTATAGDVSTWECIISNYKETTFNKSFLIPSFMANARTTTNLSIFYAGGQWRSTAAISSILLQSEGGGNLKTGSRITLYGEK